MFRSARWRSEKNKIKVVFRLQFHATQVHHVNTEGLILSMVPGDVGKPTLRLEKAMVQEGCCRWESPVYETVKFVHDAKTGKVNQRIYHLTVSTMGSAKAGSIGEASIDFADYADAIKACNVSLPLRNSNSKAMLHVLIQRLLEDTDPQREVDESGRLKKQSGVHGFKSHLSTVDTEESHKNDSKEVGPFSKAARIAELRRRASIESDSTLSSSDSVSELNTPGEIGNREDNIQRNNDTFTKSLGHNTLLLRSATSMSEEPHVSESEWSGSSDHGISTDDSTNSSNDTIPRDISRNSSDVEIEKLKSDLVALTRQADFSELELQSLRKQIVKESKRSQDLLREVTNLKQERDSLKTECERLKSTEKQKARNKLAYEGNDPRVLLEEIRQELDYEKDLNSNLRIQLQKTQESNTELILAVQDLEAMLEQRNNEGANLSSRPERETDEDEDQKALEELVKGHVNTKDTHLLEQKITELYNEIEIYKRDKDELEIQLEQIALDYEILKQENHDISNKLEQSQLQDQLKMQYECSSSLVNVNELENQVESLESELKDQSEEFAESLNRIKELENRIEGLEEELEKQGELFEADIESITSAKVEQEQRAIRAEEALRKTRWKNASVAEKLQEEFKRLSVQMASTFEANENMAMRAMTEANELRMQKRQLEETLKVIDDEVRMSRNEYETKLNELSKLVNLKTIEIERISENLDEKSKQLENQKRHEENMKADLTREIERLKDEIESVRKEKNTLIVQVVELEEMRESITEAEASIQRGNTERNELSNTIALMKKESETLMEDLHELKRVKEEKETTITQLQEEIESVRTECDDLKRSLSKNENERNELSNTIVLMKKESESLMEDLHELKRVKEEKETTITQLQAEIESVRTECDDLKRSLSKNENEIEKQKKNVSQLKSDQANLEKKLKESKTVINNITKAGLRNKGGSVAHASKEVSSMKERIKLLEGHIKMKENALEASSNMFIEKERDLKSRIEELETRLEELLNPNNVALSDHQNQKIVAEVNIDAMLSEKSDDLVTELASLKERNREMENELKEMQERYSEISLKFAEVEGERQQLVMTVRNLRNSKKS